MRAVHVIQRYTPAVLTGSEKALALLCTSLAQGSDLETVVITSNVDPGTGFYDPRQKRFSVGTEAINGVTVVRLAADWFAASCYYVLNKALRILGLPVPSTLRFLAFGPHLRGLERAILDQNPDLVHALPMPMAQTLQAWRIAHKHHLPFVITPTMHFDDPMFDNKLIYTILKQSDGIIAHTQFEKDELVRRGIEGDKIVVIPSSYLHDSDFALVDVSGIQKKYDISAKQPIALFLGSKSFDKGLVHLAEAWPKVRQALPDARLIIAGGTTSSWAEKRKTADLTGVVELDYISDEEKQQLLSLANVVCVPSRAESFGMILLESWAKGKPFIGGSAGATRELITEGSDGWTVEFGDVAAIADRLTALLSDKTLQQKMGQAGQRKAKQFTEKQIVTQTLALYDRVVKR